MAEDETSAQLEGMREMLRLQAHVCYMNVDRTLATWTRTALALIVFGTVVDRYGLLLLYPHPGHTGTLLAPNPSSSIGGIALIVIGTVIVIAMTVRHELYLAQWRKDYRPIPGFGPWLALPFAIIVSLVGIAVLASLLAFAE